MSTPASGLAQIGKSVVIKASFRAAKIYISMARSKAVLALKAIA